MAIRAIEGLIEGKHVVCDDRGKDDYGRTIGVCKANEMDVNAAMIDAGMAWSFRKYSHAYDRNADPRAHSQRLAEQRNRRTRAVELHSLNGHSLPLTKERESVLDFLRRNDFLNSTKRGKLRLRNAEMNSWILENIDRYLYLETAGPHILKLHEEQFASADVDQGDVDE